MVSCHEQRDLTSNRKIARKLMIEKLDVHLNGSVSKAALKYERLRRRKASASRKSKKKYATIHAGKNDSDAAAADGSTAFRNAPAIASTAASAPAIIQSVLGDEEEIDEPGDDDDDDVEYIDDEQDEGNE
jgi:hypothetical protein